MKRKLEKGKINCTAYQEASANSKGKWIPGIHLTLPKMSSNRRYMALGLFACMAIGTFTFASGFKSASSAEAEKAIYASPQTNSTNINDKSQSSEKNQAAEIESLRRQVQATSKKFKEYQAQLFRSSHPKDQKKIAELGQLLSEKEKLNNQLSNSLKAVEKELATAHKQVANLEVASEALNSLLNANRIASEKEIKNLKEEMEHLTMSYGADKQDLLTKIESNESQRQTILAKIETFKNDKKNLLAQIEAYENDKQDLLAKIGAFENEKHNLEVTIELHENDKQNLINKIESYESEKHDLLAKIEFYEREQQNIQNDIEQKQASIEALKNEELQSAQAVIQAHEARIQELENTYNNSQSLASELSSKLADAHEKHSLTQQKLSSTLDELDNAKSSLLELEASAAELDSLKGHLEQQRLAAEADNEETLAIIHSYYQTSLEEVATELKDAHDQLSKEVEKTRLLQEEFDQLIVAERHNEEFNNHQQNRIDDLTKDLIETKLKLVFNEQRIEQLNQAVAIHQSQQKHQIDHLQTTLEKERLELNALKNEVQNLNDEKIALESTKAVHEAEIATLKQQAEVDKASAELSFVVRETELTAYQLMLQIEIERLNAEIAENNSKISPHSNERDEDERTEETIRF